MRAEAVAPKPLRFNTAFRVLAVVLALTLFAAAALPLLQGAGGLPAVSRLEISGDLQRLPVERLRERLEPLLQGDLLSLDLAALRAAAEQEPWVARARVERVWPDAVRVSVDEREAEARWGGAALLTAAGQVFTPPSEEIPPDLIGLSGPEGSATRVLEAYRALAPLLAESAWALRGLQLDARGEWRADTVAGVELRFGRGDPAPVLGAVAPALRSSLAPRTAEIAYVDLRYSNGFAVGWRDNVATGDKP